MVVVMSTHHVKWNRVSDHIHTVCQISHFHEGEYDPRLLANISM